MQKTILNNNIAVIIPAYNRIHLLKRAIDSVFSQNLIPDELLVVDDASIQSLKPILYELYSDKKCFKVIRNKNNIGVAAARNIGLDNTKSNYIAFLDSDDYWTPDKLQTQLALIQNKPETGLVYCDQYIIKATGQHIQSGKQLHESNLWEYLINGWTAPNTSTIFIKREVLEMLGRFDEYLSGCEDHDLWMRIALAGVKVRVIDRPMSFFAINAEKRSSYNYELRINGVMKFLLKWKEQISRLEGKRKYYQFRSDYIFKTMLPIAAHAIRNGDSSTFFRIFYRHLFSNYNTYIYIIKRLYRALG